MDNIITDRRSLSQFVGKTGAELGVRNATFSRILLAKSRCDSFYSIDKWDGDRGHNAREYMRTLNRLRKFGSRSIVMRLEFSEALPLFSDEFFDFIYLDGYAHDGQSNRETIHAWWPKVKSGGCFAGHDYDAQFPLVIKHVDEFAAAHNLQLRFTTEKCPSWFTFKP